jgi:hypothetical protein
LREAIEELQDAITGLSNKTFTITANINTNGNYTSSDTSGGTSSYNPNQNNNTTTKNGTYTLSTALSYHPNTGYGNYWLGTINRKTYKKNSDGSFSISKSGLAYADNYDDAKIVGYYKGTTKVDGENTHIINMKQADGDFVRLNFTDVN